MSQLQTESTPSQGNLAGDAGAALERDRPSFHAGGAASWSAAPDLLRALAAYTRPGSRTIETGCGASTVVFAAAGAVHTAISPDAREHELVSRYCDRIGVPTGDTRFIAGLSDVVLPTLPNERVFDAAFIDGAHSFPYPAVDWHYISERLRIGGRLFLDDIPIPAVSSVFRFMQIEPFWRLDEILDDRVAVFTLLAEPPPELYTAQRSNRHNDYSFAPLPLRLRLGTSDRARDLRRAVGARAPWARERWQRLTGRRT